MLARVNQLKLRKRSKPKGNKDGRRLVGTEQGYQRNLRPYINRSFSPHTATIHLLRNSLHFLSPQKNWKLNALGSQNRPAATAKAGSCLMYSARVSLQPRRNSMQMRKWTFLCRGAAVKRGSRKGSVLIAMRWKGIVFLYFASQDTTSYFFFHWLRKHLAPSTLPRFTGQNSSRSVFVIIPNVGAPEVSGNISKRQSNNKWVSLHRHADPQRANSDCSSMSLVSLHKRNIFNVTITFCAVSICIKTFALGGILNLKTRWIVRKNESRGSGKYSVGVKPTLWQTYKIRQFFSTSGLP